MTTCLGDLSMPPKHMIYCLTASGHLVAIYFSREQKYEADLYAVRKLACNHWQSLWCSSTMICHHWFVYKMIMRESSASYHEDLVLLNIDSVRSFFLPKVT